MKRSIITEKFNGALPESQFGPTVPIKKNARKLSVADLWNIQNHRKSFLPHSGLAL